MTAQTRAVFLALLLSVLPATARAEGDAAPDGYQPPAWPDAPSAGDLTGRLGLMTVAVLVVAGAVIWWARRLPGPARGSGADAVPMNVLEAVSLGGGCSLHLLQVEQAHYLVGIDRNGLQAIHALAKPFEQFLEPDEEERDGAALLQAPPAPASPVVSG